MILVLLVAPVAHAQAPDWIGTLAQLRLGMRPRQPPPRASTVEEATSTLRQAGARIDCRDMSWVSDEEGVLDGHCEGRWTVEGQEVALRLTFQRYEIPGEDGTPRLLTVEIDARHGGGTAWLERVGRALAAAHVAPTQSGADRRWRLRGRYLLLHDPSNEPCAGFCVPYLWLGGARHPQLGPRGF